MFGTLIECQHTERTQMENLICDAVSHCTALSKCPHQMDALNTVVAEMAFLIGQLVLPDATMSIFNGCLATSVALSPQFAL